MTHERTQILIIGGGAAGYTAAIYAARAGRRPVLVEGYQPGGQMTITTDVENFPGFSEPVEGPWLMEQMRAQALRAGADIRAGEIISVDLAGHPFFAKCDDGSEFRAQTIIIATGAQARWLGIEPEYLRGRGISGCATCDGAFFRGQEVAVIGGGNTAIEEALYLSNIASRVHVIHRRDVLRAEQVMQDRLAARPNVVFHWNSTVTAFDGSEESGLTGIFLEDKEGFKSHLPVAGAFVAIGHDPASGLFAEQIDCDENGYIRLLPGTPKTSRSYVFAAGDVADPHYRQAVTAAGSGCQAALEAIRALDEMPGRPED